MCANLADGRMLVYSARSGLILGARGNPLDDSKLQAAIRKMLATRDGPIRYALAKAVSPRCTCFVNLESGNFSSNVLPRSGLFLERGIAKAAARAMNQRAASILGGKPMRVQVVAVKMGAKPKALTKVQSRVGWYRPRLNRNLLEPASGEAMPQEQS